MVAVRLPSATSAASLVACWSAAATSTRPRSKDTQPATGAAVRSEQASTIALPAKRARLTKATSARSAKLLLDDPAPWLRYDRVSRLASSASSEDFPPPERPDSTTWFLAGASSSWRDDGVAGFGRIWPDTQAAAFRASRESLRNAGKSRKPGAAMMSPDRPLPWPDLAGYSNGAFGPLIRRRARLAEPCQEASAFQLAEIPASLPLRHPGLLHIV